MVFVLGREKEMEILLEELGNVTEHRGRKSGVIIITGSGGMGKTKLLRAMKSTAAQMNFRHVDLLIDAISLCIIIPFHKGTQYEALV